MTPWLLVGVIVLVVIILAIALADPELLVDVLDGVDD